MKTAIPLPRTESSEDDSLTSQKPQGLKVHTFRIRLSQKSPKVEKLGFGPISCLAILCKRRESKTQKQPRETWHMGWETSSKANYVVQF